MKLLLDTNIAVDIVAKRRGYEASLNVLRLCETRKATGYVTTATIMDLMYILRNYLSPGEARNTVRLLLKIVKLTPVESSDIHNGLNAEMKDYEDAVQLSCAKRIKADYIVTRNISDYTESNTPAILPEKIIPKIMGPQKQATAKFRKK
ncbi:MAG: PIN domain-containing protein [Candidatus Symbiothrix sp.]|jgi:predicted nucleic acid-binding protein|nr:PIN domain-containing protein [Candidatus Symbiothrix sp.]